MTGSPGKPNRFVPQEGFIQLWRRLRQHRYWPRGRAYTKLEAWIDTLYEVAHTHRERYWHGVWVVEERGEWVTSDRELATRWRWSRKAVRRWLAGAESVQEVSLKRYPWGTRITVLGIAHCVNPGPSKETSEGPARAQRGTTSKEGKEGKETNRPELSTGDPQLPEFRDLTRKAIEIHEAYQCASKTKPIPSPREIDLLRQAIKANGGDHMPILETVRRATTEGTTRYEAGEADRPVGSVMYGLRVWEREQEAKTRRGSVPERDKRRDPESRPMRPASHELARPQRPDDWTDADSESGAAHIGAIIKEMSPSHGDD